MSIVAGSINRCVRVIRAIDGMPEPDDFALDELPVPVPGPGEVLFRAIYMSLDPSMRRKLPSVTPITGPHGRVASVGDVVIAGQDPAESGYHSGIVGQVLTSNHPGFAPGDFVKGGNRWQLFHVARGDLLIRLDPSRGALADELGILGQPGFVAWCGLEFVGKVTKGDVVVVSAAGGAVGMAAGQLARLKGARVVGVSSGSKCGYVVGELGFDACIDRNLEPLGAALDRVCPDGIDVYFDNVGGVVQRAAFDRLRDFGRLVVCGMAAEYNAQEAETGPPLRPVLRKRLQIGGFVVYDHYDRYDEYRGLARRLLAQGKLRYRLDIINGLENAAAGLIGLLNGENRGKRIVQLAPDPIPKRPATALAP